MKTRKEIEQILKNEKTRRTDLKYMAIMIELLLDIREIDNEFLNDIRFFIITK